MACRKPFAMVVLVALAGCGPPVRGDRRGDAGGQGGQGGAGSGGAGGGTGGGGAGGSSGCTNGEPTCDGRNVRLCEAGKPSGPVIEACGGAAVCSNGRCTSSACADADSKRTFVGCLFYTLDIDNSKVDDPLKLAILLGNPRESGTANVQIETRKPGMPWTASMMAAIMPGEVQSMRIADNHHEGGGLGAALAFRITSDNPIVAYDVQSDDSGPRLSETTGGTMLLPAHVLGRSYMPITYTQFGSWAAASQVAIIGTRNGTTLKFTGGLKASTRAEGGVPAKGPGESFEMMLDDGDTFQIYSDSEGDDLTGSLIEANHPVAVFSGNIATEYGMSKGVQSEDMTHEQMIPLAAWGKQYVASRLLPQTECGGKTSVSLWRVLASEDGTTVGFDAPPGVTGVPSSPATLDRGRYIEIGVGGPKGKDGDFFINADKPVLVAQFPACEPAMALAVPTEQLLQDFLFVTPPIFDHQLAVVRKAGTMVTLDGMTLADTIFSPAGGGFEVARVTLPKCGGLGKSCGHRLKGTDIGVALRGQDTICGYAFSGGMAVRCVNRTAGCR